MRKLLLNIFIVIPFLAICILSIGSPSDTTKRFKSEYQVGNIISRLNGQVKSIVEYMYPYTTNESGMIVPDFSEKNPWYHHTVNFNQDGTKEFSDIDRFSGGLNIEYISHDENGNVTEMIHYYGNDTTNFVICEYDEINNLILEKYLSPSRDKIEILEKYKYNESNCIILTKSYSPNGEVFFKNQYSYDSDNNLVSWDAYAYENNVLKSHYTETFFYVFDDYQNWIYKYRYINSELDNIELRKIEYYK